MAGGFLNVFQNDPFTLYSMTNYINKLPPVFNYLGSEGVFNEKGSSSVTVSIEENQGKLSLIENSQRGTKGQTLARDKRKVRPFLCVHKQINDEVLADQVLGVRMFGSETETETVGQKIAEKMELAQQSMEITLEHMRLGAVMGKVMDADGQTVITNLFDEFETKQYKEEWEIDPKDKSGAFIDGALRKKCNALHRRTYHVLGGTPFTGLDILCGDDLFDAIENSKEVRGVYHNTPGYDWLIEKHVYRYFEYGGIRFVNYQGWIGNMEFIPKTKGYLLPKGVPDLFTLIFGPADYVETVNTVGVKYYAKQRPLDFEKGYEIECQTNPLALCTRPDVLCEITLKS